MKRGEWDEMARDDEVCVVKWKDTKTVLLMSSCIGSEPENVCRRWSKEEKKKIDVKEPAVVKMYNANMGGIELCDRLLAYY